MKVITHTNITCSNTQQTSKAENMIHKTSTKQNPHFDKVKLSHLLKKEKKKEIPVLRSRTLKLMLENI